MFARSRSLIFTAAACLAVAAVVTTGCSRKNPKSEIRLPRTSLSDASGSSFGAGSWQPGDGPGAGSLFDSASMSRADGDMFGFNGSVATDAASGGYLNTASSAGVEDGMFTSELEMVHFPFDSSEIIGEMRDILQGHARWINQHSSLMVQIEGHTDERGTEEYNLSLGQRRADAVRNFLIDHGVDPNRLATISYGKLRPLTFDQAEEAHALNRRAMFLVYDVPDNSMASMY